MVCSSLVRNELGALAFNLREFRTSSDSEAALRSAVEKSDLSRSGTYFEPELEGTEWTKSLLERAREMPIDELSIRVFSTKGPLISNIIFIRLKIGYKFVDWLQISMIMSITDLSDLT
eukprot:scpid12822/ scgid31750/ 